MSEFSIISRFYTRQDSKYKAVNLRMSFQLVKDGLKVASATKLFFAIK